MYILFYKKFYKVVHRGGVGFACICKVMLYYMHGSIFCLHGSYKMSDRMKKAYQETSNTYYIEKFLELSDEQVLEAPVLMCVKWMGNDAVKAMMKANDIMDLTTN